MKGAVHIFRFLSEAAAAGQRTALVTLTDVLGRSAREPGLHMAVCETGASLGSFSGGCAEAAIVAEAQRVIASGEAESVRFGLGSRFIDIRLPCGGGIDLLFTPDPPADVIAAAARSLAARTPVTLVLSRQGGAALSGEGQTGWIDGHFAAHHEPDLSLVIAGHGDEIVSLTRLAAAYGADVHALTPDEALLERLRGEGAQVQRLTTAADSAKIVDDPYTAIVLLFHDHDWETALLVAALETRAFYIGAMGSRQTHVARVERLEQAGVSPREIARIVAPIGSIHAVRDPDTLALSIMAQVVQIARDIAVRGSAAAPGRIAESRSDVAHRPNL